MILNPPGFGGILAHNISPRSHARHLSKFDIYGNSPIPKNKARFVPTSGDYPKGFNVGIKPTSKSQPDLILVASEIPSSGAAVFTKNEFPAVSITVSRELLNKSKGEGLRGVIANSWCANTLTGKIGLDDAFTMSKEANKLFTGGTDRDSESSHMVMHTGVGGQWLPINDIVQNIPMLHQRMGKSHENWLNAAKGICTTDTFPKVASRTFTLPSSPKITFRIAGITKGAGMIHPNMATTLGIICTDAPATSVALQQLFSTAADKSYNCISIDGDTSTNDMVAMIANGAAGGTKVDFQPLAPSQSEDFLVFQRILIEFMAEMAKLVVRDGEGATKFVTIRVRGSPSYPAAKVIASVIARSILVKTAIYGKDPNWGGILAALGYSLAGTEFAGKGIIVPELTSITFLPVNSGTPVKFLNKGIPSHVDEEMVKHLMDQEDVEVVVDLRDEETQSGLDIEEAVYWTCDLTHDFVTINGDFTK